jgi:hypothetical protein
MPGHTTILTVFGRSDAELQAIEQSILADTTKLKRLENVFYIQVAAKPRFTHIAAGLDAQDIKYAYYFVEINDQADLYTHGLEEATVTALEDIAMP